MADAPGGLFTLAAERSAGRGVAGAMVSAVVHVALLGAVVVAPFLPTERLPEVPDGQHVVFLYDPPPPPPPPPLRGSSLVRRDRSPDRLPAPLAVPDELRTPPLPALAVEGDDAGDDEGSPEGMEGGVAGGTVGGIPGGVIGGVVGGTGTGPVPWSVPVNDEPPRALSTPRPAYPNDAFAKKVEGIVLLEILIDESGRVAEARILHSIPLLDRAALEAVKCWRFRPATRQGHPVAALARAPITFRIL